MTSEELKKEIEIRERLPEYNKNYKASPRAILFMAGIMATLAAVSTVGGYFKYKRYQREQIQAEKDAQTEMTLIDMKGNVTGNGYAGLMFFSRTGNTNHADAVMHYGTINPAMYETIRHLKIGEKRKVAEWKGLVADKYVKRYSWHELER